MKSKEHVEPAGIYAGAVVIVFGLMVYKLTGWEWLWWSAFGLLALWIVLVAVEWAKAARRAK